MPGMPGDDPRSRVGGVRWYHTIDFGQGLVTAGVDDSAYRLARLDFPPSLDGRSVLDIGAWDGFFSFEAERRGAARVLASDWYSWHGPGWGKKAGFELARTILETVVDLIGLRRPAMAFYPERQLNDDPTNWWGPNAAAVHAMLRAVGFARSRSVTPQPSAIYRGLRAAAHHLKGKNEFHLAFRQDRMVFHAEK